MAKSAKSIEPGVLDELNRLGAARRPIADWLAGLEASREDVAEPVYRRVREDYTKRIADLDHLTRHLRVEATRTIGVLDEQLAQLAKEQGEIELDLQELELRHQLEEYSDDEFESRAREPRERIEELVRELGEVRATRELWLAARGEEIPEPAAPAPISPPAPFTSMAPVATAAPTPPPAPAPPKSLTTVGVAPGPVEITLPHPIPPPRTSSPGIPLPQTGDAAARTVHLPGPASAAPSMPAPVEAVLMDRTVIYTPTPPDPVSDPGESGDPGDPAASTMRLQASLVPVDAGDGAARVHVLAAENTLGRVRENSIQIQQGSVSRHHAILQFTADGWMLENLGAENGTWVNGERIEKCRLSDGDRVNIGTVRFQFRIG